MTSEKPLQEKNFIQENYSKHPYPIWIWGGFLIVFSALLWGLENWYVNKLDNQYNNNPFLQVTNREISIFLWQSSSYMRKHVSNKEGYLPGFQYIDKIGLDPIQADDYVLAPPELLFLYHTWHRLIGSQYFPKNIPESEFAQFLVYCPEWYPENWPGASAVYIDYINRHLKQSTNSSAIVPEQKLSLMVKQAFQGWKNYFKEGAQINAENPTYSEMNIFIQHYPHYARSYWRNITEGSVYLKHNENTAAIIPNDELAPFLKVAYFNYKQSLKP